MDRETILPEMTDIREPAMVAYTAVGESRPVALPPDARKTSAEPGKEEEEEAMPITDHTINLTNLNKKKPT